jgi:hypothetical protein
MSTIKVIDFSKDPGARYPSDGPNSGEEFFTNRLDAAFKTALDNHEKLTVDLDGTSGYASSFLSEAFGLLAEKYGVEITLKNLEIISNEEPDWKIAILTKYIPNANERKKKVN